MNQTVTFNSPVLTAMAFARGAHAAVGQVRKFNGAPYIIHPARVVTILTQYTSDENLLGAAWLHDVVEDTGVSAEYLATLFPARMVAIVAEVTNVSKPEDGNRKVRKALDVAHLSNSTRDGATLKLADVFANCEDAVAEDPKFAVRYCNEKIELLKVLGHGNTDLWNRVMTLLKDNLAKLAEMGYTE